MKFLTLKGREVRITILPSQYPMRSRSKCRSEGQYNLGRALCSIYGSSATILEEFPIPDSRLSLDYYMPHHGIAFEFQGIQHDQYNPYFHVDNKGFQQQKVRDADKRRWCDLNDITLVEVRDRNIAVGILKTAIKEARDG